MLRTRKGSGKAFVTKSKHKKNRIFLVLGSGSRDIFETENEPSSQRTCSYTLWNLDIILSCSVVVSEKQTKKYTVNLMTHSWGHQNEEYPLPTYNRSNLSVLSPSFFLYRRVTNVKNYKIWPTQLISNHSLFHLLCKTKLFPYALSPLSRRQPRATGLTAADGGYPLPSRQRSNPPREYPPAWSTQWFNPLRSPCDVIVTSPFRELLLAAILNGYVKKR